MPAPPASHDVPQPGDVLGGKYRVEALIGIGGMGAVVAARHIALGHRVAVKVLLAAAAKLDGAVARFLREARAAASLGSEHVCKVLDVGETEDGRPFMVIELLFGMDLGTVIATEPALPIAIAADYVLQACEAIAEAHSLGIIHRDLKPSNLFLTKKPDGAPLVKVLDFGISKMTNEIDVAITTTEMAFGTPLYMSPEQLRSLKTVDARTDVWALGVILHQLVAQRPPFEGTTLTALSAAIASDEPTPLRRDRPDAPQGLEALVARSLEKLPAKRHASVAEFARELSQFASPSSAWLVERIAHIASGAPAPPLPSPSGAADVRGDTRSAWGQTRGHGGQPKKWLLGIATTTMLASLVGIAFLAWPKPRATPPSIAAASTQPAATTSAPPATSAPAPAEATATAPAAASSAPPSKKPKVPINRGHVIDPLQERH